MTIIFLESPELDTQGFWRKQNSTTHGSVNLREISEVYHVDMLCAGVSFICAYVLDTETNQSLTTIHCHFHTPTSLRPCHFDSHSHFSSPFLVLETQKLEPSRTKKTTPSPCTLYILIPLTWWQYILSLIAQILFSFNIWHWIPMHNNRGLCFFCQHFNHFALAPL